MINPFEPKHDSVQMCPRCRKALDASDKPGVIENFIGILALLGLFWLATHGLMTLLRQYGLVTADGSRFWFENDLHRWVWGV